MATIAVIYHSDSGTTRLLAEGVSEGAASVAGCESRLHEIDRRQIAEGRYANAEQLDALDAADAVVFGCPTFMGDVSGPMKALLDATLDRWYARRWSGKLAAGFTVSSTPSGDKLGCLASLMTCAMQHGMVWVDVDQSPINAEGLNRLGCYIGVAAQPDYASQGATSTGPVLMRGDRETGVALGARVARLSLALASTSPRELSAPPAQSR